LASAEALAKAARPQIGNKVIGLRKDRLFFQVRIEQLKDVSLNRTGRRLDVRGPWSRAAILPQIGNNQSNLKSRNDPPRSCKVAVLQFVLRAHGAGVLMPARLGLWRLAKRCLFRALLGARDV
jgi:hypothetical protein